jgi:pimeloyl-ACP methyl ester carboxylesterase
MAATSGGVELAYTATGAGDPLVLIMGLGADRTAWDLHVEAFATGFRCFAVDNRGAGTSGRPDGPYTTAAMADDYAALIDRLGLGPVRVAGISMGGAIAQELALRRPDLVQRMVLVSTWARCDAYTKEIFQHFAAMHSVADAEEFTRLLQLWIWTPEHVGANLDELRAARRAPGAMTPEAFAAQCAACIDHDALDRLGEIGAPTLITSGDRDIFTPLAYAEELHTHIPGSELVVFPGTGHAHHWEALEAFNHTVMEWLR